MVSIDELQLAIDKNLMNESAQSGSQALRLAFFYKEEPKLELFKTFECSFGIYFILNDKKYICLKLVKRKSLKYLRDSYFFYNSTIVHLLNETLVLIVKYFQTNPLIYDFNNIFTDVGLGLIQKKKSKRSDQSIQTLSESHKLYIAKIVEQQYSQVIHDLIEENIIIDERLKILEDNKKGDNYPLIKQEHILKHEENDSSDENPYNSGRKVNPIIERNLMNKYKNHMDFKKKKLRLVIFN